MQKFLKFAPGRTGPVLLSGSRVSTGTSGSRGYGGAGTASSCGEHAKLWAHRASHCESSESHSVTCAIFVGCFLNLKKTKQNTGDLLPVLAPWLSTWSWSGPVDFCFLISKTRRIKALLFPSKSPGAQPHRESFRPPTPVTQWGARWRTLLWLLNPEKPFLPQGAFRAPSPPWVLPRSTLMNSHPPGSQSSSHPHALTTPDLHSDSPALC